ncbi:prolyl oligopeptidase family serine peptidase [Aquirufa sp.]|jgi:dipeptidyl aminopeptidase/acylaminoacyl peptidase|uniref:alpha/beta hydrolase family protein n=1 Tax=Aquirufa sp. TaxID=2676249 RepID=UPI0037BF8238
MKKSTLLLSVALFIGAASLSHAQDTDAYQLPPKEIADLLLAKPTPFVRIDSKAEYLLLLGRNSYPSVEELGQPEMKIAGLRLNPLNFSPSRQSPISSITLQSIKSGAPIAITGLPKNLAAGAIAWNPSETKIAFTQSEVNRVDLYVIDIATKKATRVNNDPINQVLGNAFTWVDDQTILYKATTHDAAGAPKRPITPKGPTIQQNIGKAAPRPTFQDLIKSPYDESLFAYYAESQLVLYKNGVNKKVGKPELTNSFQLSPDRQYVMTRTLTKPFSYAVPAYGFTSTVSVMNLEGKVIKELAKLPSAESAPAGNDNVQNVPRGFEWRDDEPASIVYAMPLDSGFIKKQVEFHDAVYSLAAPFTQAAKELFKTKTRFAGVTWGDKNLALVSEVLRGKQTSKVSRYTPQTGAMEVLYERNLTDAYRNPGSPVQTKNAFGRDVIQLIDGGTKILMNNPVGSSDKGDLPFIAKFDLITKKNEIIWRAKEGSFEMVEEVIDAEKLQVLTRKESKTDVPNYFIKNLLNPAQDKSLTQFENPYPNLVGITKEKIKYKRADGVDLTGDLYLPKGYNKEKDGPLPVLIWAYPREFNSAADAAQIRGSKDRFTTLSWASPIYYATQGYAILDNAEMPIVSTDASKKPNDNFVEQLKLNASAAIDHLVQLGVGDRKRMAVGGHSYGAFMTANLLAHTDLFKAGIARSGAYNRTLTPFGFQNEDRTYWQAPQLYFEMSPFSYADKIKEPILLVHGEQDDNTGTFPINSERLYAALKGNGGTTRFVYLPYEAHSYRGRENVLHLLWEQFQWLEKYLK